MDDERAVAPEEGELDDDAADEEAPSGPRFPLRRIIKILLVVLLIALILDGIYVAVGLPGRLRATERLLSDAQDLMSEEEPDLDAVREDLERALERADGANSLMDHPAYVVAENVPWVASNARTVRALGIAGENGAEAGLRGLAIIQKLGLEPDAENRLYVDGRMQFDVIDQIEGDTKAVWRHLAIASDALDRAPRPTIDSLDEIALRARREVGEAVEGANEASGAIYLMPELFARDTERRYLLAFMAPSEARGSGGIVGLQGIVNARDGELSLSSIQPPEIAPRDADADVTESYRAAWEDFQAFRDMRQSVLAPDFENSAKAIVAIYEEVTGAPLDGVIAMDPFVLAEMTRGTGPVRIFGFGQAIGPDNAGKLLMRDSYVRFQDPAVQNEFLGRIVDAVWRRLSSGRVNVRELAEGLGRAASTQHLKLYLEEAHGYAMVQEAGVGGLEKDAPPTQLVFHNNYGVNKVDYYLQRSIDTIVEVREDGSARVVTDISMRNRAPAQGPATLLGPPEFTDGVPGTNVMELNVMMPARARAARWDVSEGKPAPDEVPYEPYGRLIRDTVSIPPGGEMRVRVVYEVSHLVVMSDLEDDRGHLEFALYPQPLPRFDDYSLSFRLPEGWQSDVELDSSGTLETPIEVTATITK